MNDLLRRLLGLPEQASTVAAAIDHLHMLVILFTLAGALAVGATAVGFAIRYRRRPDDVMGAQQAAKPLLEWGIVASLLGLFVWWWWIGYRQYLRLQVAPDGALEVYVSAKQWMWKFAYPDGRSSISILVVPAGRPVKLLMNSRDVIHSFFVPDFRIKHDVVPGTVSTVWFQADQPGIHQILCSQYCGTSHSKMRGAVVVLGDREFAAWRRGQLGPLLTRALSDEIAERKAMVDADPTGGTVDANLLAVGDAPDIALATRGQFAATRLGCMVCHTEEGQAHLGPGWRGLFGSQVRLTDGRTVIADEQYLTRSMMDPLADLVVGYAPIMPSYQSLLDPVDTAAIVEFIKSLRQPASGPIDSHLTAPTPTPTPAPTPTPKPATGHQNER